MQLTLEARPPFDLTSVIGSHGWIRLAPFDTDDEFSFLRYVAHLSSGRVVELGISPSDEGVEVGAPKGFSQAERSEVTDAVGWMLGLDQNFTEFYKLARREPKLVHVPKQAKGRVLRSPTLFEDTVKTILTTNTAWGGTIRMVGNLVDQFGSSLPEDADRSAFPLPEQLAASDEHTLRNNTGLGYRAPYVLELARRVADGDLDLESLKTSKLSTAELREQLMAIKGVGNYAAANLLMLLGRYDFVPIDSWAFKVVSHEWHDGESIGPAEVEAAFERWGEWKGLAYWNWDWSLLA